jgi:hypothetical protein
MVALQRVKQEALRLILEEVLRAVLQPWPVKQVLLLQLLRQLESALPQLVRVPQPLELQQLGCQRYLLGCPRRLRLQLRMDLHLLQMDRSRLRRDHQQLLLALW